MTTEGLKQKIADELAATWISGKPFKSDGTVDLMAFVESISPLTERLEAAEGAVERVRALDLACELYDEPGQDCTTAGLAVFTADACTPCCVRTALDGDLSKDKDKP